MSFVSHKIQFDFHMLIRTLFTKRLQTFISISALYEVMVEFRFSFGISALCEAMVEPRFSFGISALYEAMVEPRFILVFRPSTR